MKYTFKQFLNFLFVSLSVTVSLQAHENEPTIKKNKKGASYSIETGLTIQKVRTARINKKKTIIVGASYEGTILGIDYNGEILWKNPLSGFMVHDMWCANITGDKKEEILVASADGYIFCLDSQGKLLWKHKHNEVPMYSVTTVTENGKSYVICGGFDLSIYYLDAQNGKIIKEIPSSSYSNQKPWGRKNEYVPTGKKHYANFLRIAYKENGKPIIVLHGNNNSMQTRGVLYFFNVMEDKPFKRVAIEKIKGQGSSPIGDMRIVANNENVLDILLGFSYHQKGAAFVKYQIDLDSDDNEALVWDAKVVKRLGFGYVVAQNELIKDVKKEKYLTRVGRFLLTTDTDLSNSSEKRFESKYSHYDLWKDGKFIILGSVQSGGSAIHILNTSVKGWKKAYTKLTPSKKIQSILTNTKNIRDNLKNYERPTWERKPRKVYFMTESFKDPVALKTKTTIERKYKSPIFLGGGWSSHVEKWNRSSLQNEKYKKRRDRRKKYDWSQQQVLDYILPWYDGEPGAAFWGGHGNDPYMFSLDTHKKILDGAKGKKTVLIYPELEDHSKDMEWVMNDLFYPLANYAKPRNGNIFVRTKHNFWQGNIYLPMWTPVLDGKYADVFVPSMEETTDKAMDVSIAGRVGVWCSGVFNNWGTRAVPDNPSFDRSRQFSHQRLPNHFLRHLIYHLANGATYINNFAVDQDYMSILWELVAKGALYVPKTNEVLSYSPVHLGMKKPDEHYMNEGSSLKWATFYNKEFEENNPFVFSRQSSTYMAGKNTPWDFSSIASYTKDRRQNFLPKYSNGLVLITPPQNGVFAKKDVPRGKLVDRLHPIYKNITKEYITDGRHYYSKDGKQTFAADTYAQTVSNDIKELGKKLPLKVEGEVAWVVAQTAPKHLRLTLIDGGYLNPSTKQAKVTIQNIAVKKMTDILDKTSYQINQKTKNVAITIPCGGFRFIDIELNEAIK